MVVTERRKSFPERVALVNHGMQKSYEIRFAKEEAISNSGELLLKGGESFVGALWFTTRCPAHDAVLVVRPFVRIVEGEGPLDGRLRFVVDGENVVENEPLAEYSVKDMQDPKLDVPVKWPGRPSLFYAAALTEEGAEPEKGMYGIFAINKSNLGIELLDVRCARPVRVEVGCIAATYTTTGIVQQKDNPPVVGTKLFS